MLLEEVDGLGLAVFEDLEVDFAQAGYRLAAGLLDRNIDDDVAGGGSERRRLSRYVGLGKRSASDENGSGSDETGGAGEHGASRSRVGSPHAIVNHLIRQVDSSPSHGEFVPIAGRIQSTVFREARAGKVASQE